MVRLFGLALLLLTLQNEAHALFPRTQGDLRVLQDRLLYEFGSERERRKDRDPNVTITPVLIAPPSPYWQESKDDFQAAVMETLSHVFTNPGDMIVCSQCSESRVYMSGDHRSVMQNGEISLSDLARLRQYPAYAAAKSLLIIRETPSGVSVRVIAVDDGRILYAGLADSTRTLADAEPPMRLARELDRRQRGEALNYINIDLGVYPTALVQLKFLEQWGSRNQHMSGFALSAYNPNGALGINYSYMLPFWERRLVAAATGFYKLESMFQQKSGQDENGNSAAIVGQLMVTYAISGSYGAFITGNTDGKFSVGVTLMNPILFPFLL